MSIGKSSITKRVAKTAEPEKATEKNIAPELVATVAAAPKAETKKAPAKKTTGTKNSSTKTASSQAAKKPAAKSNTAKKPAPKKETATEKLTPPTEKKVDTAVIANIAPETVAAVIGHSEKSGFEKVQLGEKMPVHLL